MEFVATASQYYASYSANSKLDELHSLLEQGRLKPVIDSVMSLAEVAEAHQKLEAGGLRGKIVLSV
jgi:NADPH:quinone reductase